MSNIKKTQALASFVAAISAVPVAKRAYVTDLSTTSDIEEPSVLKEHLAFVGAFPEGGAPTAAMNNFLLGKAIAYMYIAAQDTSMVASDAACDLMEQLKGGLAVRVGFNSVMALSKYQVRA